jgi:uncharacterized protein YecT (DUF1311 family)
MRRLLFIVLLACGPTLPAQTPRPDFNDWEQACKVITARPVQEPRFTGPLGASQLPACDSRSLYYGFGADPDYAAALQCAWHERAHPNPPIADIFRGVGVLSMLYANGRGTAQDIDLAERFTCENEWAAPYEMNGRLQALEAMRGGAVPERPFDLCDSATSGLSGGHCVSVQTRFAEVQREQEFARATGALNPVQRARYEKLRAAVEKFADTRSSNEVDMTGSMRASFALRDRDRILEQFLIDLQRFSKLDVPAASAADVQRLDAQMSSLYRRIMQVPEDTRLGGTTVKPSGIREAQRAWLKMRDAWLEFAAAAYPRLAAERVHAQQIRLRLNQFQRLPFDPGQIQPAE